MRQHPVRIVITDDLERSRLTVFFRLLLAIPHYIWLLLWSIGAFFAAIANWFATLVTGQPPAGLHRFLSAYVRYTTHLYGYLYLAANPFPPFTGTRGTYPIDLEIDGPGPQRRWVTALRVPLALPALLLTAALAGTFAGGGGSSSWNDDTTVSASVSVVGLAVAVALLGWWVAVFRGRAPLGFRNTVACALRYSAQTGAFLLLLTERYPDGDPTLPAGAGMRDPGPVRLSVDDDLRRSRLTVFFRLLLALPHLFWLALWSIAAVLASIVAWAVTLVTGRLPEPLHRFLAAFVRYDLHVVSFVFLVANPFPGFVGREETYAVDLAVDEPEPQRRLVTAFRAVVAVPALMVSSALGGVLAVAGILGWFAALATGRMPYGLLRLGAWSLRYSAETYSYLLFLTERYPYSGPTVEAEALAQAGPEPEPLAAAGA